MKRKIIFLFLMIFIITSCSKNKYKEKNSHTFFETFDTTITYTEYSDTKENFEKNASFVESEFKRLHKLFDRYHKYDVNNIYTINENAGKKPVKVDKDIIDVLKFSIENFDKTKGKVNITMGAVLEIWHNYRLKNEGLEDSKTIIPDSEELKNASRHTDINNIIIDESKLEVFIKNDKTSIDLGAVAKGYATELIAKKLKGRGVESATINAGGNVRTIGSPGDNRQTWGIAIQNPQIENGDFLDVLFVHDKSVVTSGDYQRYFTHKGKVYHHIVSPKTLQPEGDFNSVSIVTEDSGLADLLSTAIYLSTKEEAKEILSNYDDVGVLWYSKKNGKSNTENIDKYLKSKGAFSK